MIERQISLGAALISFITELRNEFIVQCSFITEFGNKLIVQPDYHPPEQRAPPANLTYSWEAYAIREWCTPLANSFVSRGA